MVNPWWLLGVLRMWARESLIRLIVTLAVRPRGDDRRP